MATLPEVSARSSLPPPLPQSVQREAARSSEVVVEQQAPSSTLMRFIECRLRDVPIPESSDAMEIRRAAISGGIVLVFYGLPGLVFISFMDTATCLGKAEHLTKDPELLALGIPLAAGNVATTLAFEVNSTIDFIKKTTRPLSPEELALLEDVIPVWKKTLLIVVSIALGLFAVFPEAWGAFKAAPPRYPTKDFNISPWVGFSMRQLQFAGPALSLYLTIFPLTRLCRTPYTGFDVQLVHARNFLADELSLIKNGLRTNSRELTTLIPKIQRLRMQFPVGMRELQRPLLEGERRSERGAAKRIFDHLLTCPRLEETGVPINRAWSVCLDAIAYLVLLPAFLSDMVNAATTGIDEFFKQDILVIIVGISVALICAKLFGSLIRRGVELPWEGLHPRSFAPITKQIRPKTYAVMTYAAPVLSIAPTVHKIAGTISFGKMALPTGVAGSAGAFFVGLASIHAGRDSLIGKLSENEPLIILDREIEKICDVLRRIKPREFAVFLRREFTELERSQYAGIQVTDAQLDLFLNGPRGL